MKALLLAALGSLTLAWLAAGPLAAQPSAGPQPVPQPPALPASRDVAYPGVNRLEVDATDLDRRIFRVRQTIPIAQAGRLSLLYPAWLPGHHAPRGQVEKLAGLVVTGAGRPIPWTRDPVDVYAFHLDVPAGVTELQVAFQFLSATAADQGRVVMTPEMLNLQWWSVALYPAGHFTRRITVEPAVKLPAGWAFGVALDVAATDAGWVRFKPVDFETLADSPMFAGRHHKQVDLDPAGRSPVRLNIFADEPAALDATAAELEAHRSLVRQADRLFGVRPFDRYDFLLALTQRMGGIGLEHHRSSENATVPYYFVAWNDAAPVRDLLPHEYVHSWNGKHRRPAELWTPDFSTPMRTSLLWVYEGQTQYWGHVLGARSGLLTRAEAMDALALTAAAYEARVGRLWRNLADTTQDPVIAARKPLGWATWQRSEDYYSEGQLIWLDVDTLIREKSGGKRSLDDLARAFFGAGAEGDRTPAPYTFEDVLAALNAVQPHDWATFLKTRIEDVGGPAPLNGLARGGYRLAWSDTPTAYFKAVETRRKASDFTYSVGFVLDREGDLTAVQWDGPAFKAGLTVGGRLLAVNGVAYDLDRLKDAITVAKAGAPLDLLVKTGDHFRTVRLDWRGGLRYPRLERIPGAVPRLDDILAARK